MRKSTPRQLTEAERNFLRILHHRGYRYISYEQHALGNNPENFITIYNKKETACLCFDKEKFTQISPLDGKVLITDFLEGKI